MAGIRSKAGKHSEDAKGRKEACEQRRVDDAASRPQRLEADARQKDAAHAANLADISSKAGNYFEEAKAKKEVLAKKEIEDYAARQQRLEEDVLIA